MPVLVPLFDIYLGSCKLRAFKQIKVKLSRLLPCDSAEINLPFLADTDLGKLKKNGVVSGGQVEIALGWDGVDPEIVFSGVITKVSPEQPLKITCADHGQALKETYLDKKTFSQKKEGPLGAEESWYSEIAHYVISKAGLTPVIPNTHDESEGDIKRKSFSVDAQTPAQVLEKLRESGWDFFVIPGTKKCYFGPPWPYARGILKQDKLFRYAFEALKNQGHIIAAPIIEPKSLTFTPADKVGKVIVHLTDADFVKPAVTAEFGDGKPVKEYSFTDSEISENKARIRARNLFLKLNSTTVKGEIKVFGNQFIKHSEQIIVRDPKHQERGGADMRLWLDEVTHLISPTEGFRTFLKLCLAKQ